MQELEARRAEELTHMDQRVAECGLPTSEGARRSAAGALRRRQVARERRNWNNSKPEAREKLARVRERLQHEIEERLRAIRELEKGARDALRALDTDTAAYATRHLMEDLRARYRDQPAVLEYLTALQNRRYRARRRFP